MTPSRDRGELALVLHTHMPYVEGFGTWPFGEEWLWEAMATCYLPLLDLLGRAPLTLSVTPVLADQLEAPDIAERCLTFLREVRRDTHERDIDGLRRSGATDLAAEVERSLGDYVRAADRLEALGGDLLGALAPHVGWTSAATHAVLPLLATEAGARLQVETGIDAHRRRFGAWRGGFWLPECGHAGWLDPLLEDAGVHAVCVDLTDVLGRDAPAHLRPLQTAAGPIAVPIDRGLVELLWMSEGSYGGDGAYRDYHHHTIHHHRPWRNDGGTYDPAGARARAREHAAGFVAAAIERLDRGAAALRRPGLAVVAFDTELLGHWWYEGIDWLAAVLDQAGRQGLALTTLDDALERHEPVPAPADGLGVTTWGTPRGLRTWSGPKVADLAWMARRAELQAAAAGPQLGERALRELLALQSSDWAFMVDRDLAGPYPRRRAAGHAEAFEAALAGGAGNGSGAVRALAPGASLAPFLTP